MKRLTKIGILTAALALTVSVAYAALNYYFSFIGTGATTLSYVAVTGAYGTPRLQYLNATSDKAGSVVQFYTAGIVQLVTGTNAAGQAVITVPGTGHFNTNDVVVIQQNSTLLCERAVVSIVTADNMTLSGNLTLAHLPGDPVYRMATAGSIPVGNATKELNAGGGAIWNGQSRKPLLFEIDGTSACKINAASGVYDVNTP